MTQISVMARSSRKKYDDAGVENPPFQGWRTPRCIFDPLNAEMHYTLDAFADHDNHLVETYYTAESDGIMSPWHGDGVVWGNPPYNGDMQEEALIKAIMEVRTAGRRPHVDLLVQASVSTKWFLLAVKSCEVNLYHGRIAFDVPPDMPNPKRPSFSNALIRIRPVGQGPVGITGMRSAKTGLML